MKITASLWMIPNCAVVNMPEGWVVIQGDIDRLEQWGPSEPHEIQQS